MPRVVIFHTSDIHNRLDYDRARFLRDLKAGIPESLVLDSGDAIWAGNAFWRPGGEPVLDLMSEVSYDAMCLGNREFHFLRTGLISKTGRAKFTILSANLRSAKNSKPDSIESFLILERSGVRIGIFGLSVPCVTQRMVIRRVADFYFDDPIESARELVPKLRNKCDLVVALTHIGLDLDRKLAVNTPGIDLILGGHTHTVTPTPEQAGHTWILHHGHHCKQVGRVEVDISQRAISVASELITFPTT
ncbi:MAG: metallophosphatase [Armatimonadetes bacterium]|nr:metallophosphatase [Armatimonadota bacterium]